MAKEQERQEPQGKKPVNINDLPEGASADESSEGVKGGMLPRAGGGGIWTDPDSDEDGGGE